MPHEYVGNLHNHTVYSDGWGRHNDVARAALAADLDFVVTTDHNVLVQGLDGYRYHGDRRVLLLTGEEIHDPDRQPQRNHLLAYEVGREIASQAKNPQSLIDTIRDHNGHSFLAHPVDSNASLFNEGDLSWVSWDVSGFTGLEVWNFMTEFKALLTSWPRAIYYAYQPHKVATGPPPGVLSRWDQLLAAGRRVVAIGGADGHAMPVRKGPLERVVFPYEFLFRAVNTHVLTERPLTGAADQDRRLLFDALGNGRCFVGYDLPAPTHGFRFRATSDRGAAQMGDSLSLGFGVTFQIFAPLRCRIRLLCDGEILSTWYDSDQVTYTSNQPGAYRVEAYLPFEGQERTWVLSNPIYVQAH